MFPQEGPETHGGTGMTKKQQKQIEENLRQMFSPEERERRGQEVDRMFDRMMNLPTGGRTEERG